MQVANKTVDFGFTKYARPFPNEEPCKMRISNIYFNNVIRAIARISAVSARAISV